MDLTWLYPRSLTEFGSVMLAALVLDFLYPIHRGVLYRIHPVHTAYFMALRLARALPKNRVAGAATWFVVVFAHMALYGLMLYVSNAVTRLLWLVVATYTLKTSVSLRLLIDHVRGTALCLEREDLECARGAIAGAVRRDVSRLGKGHVASAAIETLFENIVDGFTSPILYYSLAGPLGALLQRLVNTMDAALGYKVGDFAKIGWFSARADDLINYVPARFTGALMIALCMAVGGSPREGLAVLARNGKRVESVNGRIVMSVASGCLRVRLEKLGAYTIGKEFAFPTSIDLVRALRLSMHLCIIYTVAQLPLYELCRRVIPILAPS